MRQQRHLWCRVGAGGLAALAAALLAMPAARPQGISPVSLHEDAQGGKTHLLASYYRSGMARLAGGDPAGARTVFEAALAAAPAVPQVQASLAAAMLLADFAARERALPLIRAAVAAEPRHPLYRIIAVLADPAASRLVNDDGALYLTVAAARTLDEAAGALTGAPDVLNAKSLALVLSARTPTGDTALPERIPGFAAMLGTGRGVALPQLGERVSLGRLLELAVPDAAFKPYEVAFVERLLQGRATGADLTTATSQ